MRSGKFNYVSGPRSGSRSKVAVAVHPALVPAEQTAAVSQFGSGWDANWLVCDIELDVGLLGDFRAHHRPSILTVEFERFRDQLRVLDEKLAGTAALEHTEEQVGLTVRLNAGKGTLEGSLQTAPLVG